jgi:hypothetical protein|tara:strand:- start:703 stop:1077 length:375 start_codon:yes stop_codon:yes gene_type:complete
MAFRKFKDIEYPVPGVDTAIQVLRPGAQYDMISRGGIIWNEWIDKEGREPPTNQEIGLELIRQNKIYAYYEYERNREKQYPDIKEQLDNLYHDIKNNNLSDGEWIKSIDKVKSDNPKPDAPPPI